MKLPRIHLRRAPAASPSRDDPPLHHEARALFQRLLEVSPRVEKDTVRLALEARDRGAEAAMVPDDRPDITANILIGRLLEAPDPADAEELLVKAREWVDRAVEARESRRNQRET